MREWLATGTVALALIACGDGGEGGGKSGVSSDELLSALNEADSQKLCRFYEKTYKGSLGSEAEYCTAWSVGPGTPSEWCEEYKQECLDEKRYRSDLEEDWECEATVAGEFAGTGCTATVAEFEACVTADAREFRRFASTASCDDPEAESQTIAECELLREKCPDVSL